MAKMIPTFGPAETESRAEPTIYCLLKEQLSDEFIVIHSLPWLRSAAKEIGAPFTAPTGEIDFIVLHKDLGVLAIEVKGGRYRIEGAAFVPVAGGRPQFVLHQTRKNIHGVAEWLSGKTSIRWRMGYAMCFPASVFPDDSLPPGAFDAVSGERLTIDLRDLHRIGERVIQVMRFWKSALSNGMLGHDRLETIVDALCPQYDGTPQWSHRILYDGQFWLRLTAEQSNIVERVLNAGSGLVTGWPGTGKTLVGVEVARRLSSTGQRVVFVTFNALLGDYLRKQLAGTGCYVSTWHKLCHIGRELLDGAVTDEQWFETECLGGLKAAVASGRFEFDALIVDEAQALRPAWWEYLSSWFRNKPIFAFCDETQVFSFERETTSLTRLSEILADAQVQHLSVVLRMPRAVTERLMEVQPSQVQISTPRMLEPDTITELAVDDWYFTLQNLVSKIIEQGATLKDIVVLSKTGYVRAGIQQVINGTVGLQHSLVAKFRGMESPIVIIVEADEFTEIELFSAYSRATTACFALFSADAVRDDIKNGFLNALMQSASNWEVINEVRLRRTVAYGLSSHAMRPVEALKTIDLTWSRTLEAWIVVLKKNTPRVLWIDFLRAWSEWPVLFYYEEEPQNLKLALPRSPEEFDHSPALRLCTSCDEVTPHSIIPSQCLVCQGLFRQVEAPLMTSHVQKLIQYDEAISLAQRAENMNELLGTYQQLPYLLGTVAFGLYAWNRSSGRKPHLFLPDKSSLYRAAVTLAHARALVTGGSKAFTLDGLTTETFHDDFDGMGVTRDDWRKKLGFALSRLYQQEVLEKVKKGTYRLNPYGNELL